MVYWASGNALTYGFPRYHYAAMPFIMMYVAALLASWLQPTRDAVASEVDNLEPARV
jgi:hypothetical protein